MLIGIYLLLLLQIFVTSRFQPFPSSASRLALLEARVGQTIRWAHGVNTQAALENAFASHASSSNATQSTLMLEADVMPATEQRPDIFMCHPPCLSGGGLAFKEWLDRVLKLCTMSNFSTGTAAVPPLATHPQPACVCLQPRPLLSGWLVQNQGRGGGGGAEAKKVICVPKLDLHIQAPLINFILCLRKYFLMWVGWTDLNHNVGRLVLDDSVVWITHDKPATMSQRESSKHSVGPTIALLGAAWA